MKSKAGIAGLYGLCILMIVSCREEEIKIALSKITIEAPSTMLDLDVTTTLTLSATGVDQNNDPIALENLLWSSSNLSIATVDNTGLVTGIGRGQVTITATSGAVSASQPISILKSITSAELKSGIQALADARSGTGKIPGISVSVLLKDGNQIDVVSGVSEVGTPIVPEMRFGLASITKTAIAATVLKLESEGILSLNDPISQWLALGLPNVDHSITIYQLLNHQSGLSDYFNHPDIWPTVEGNLDQAITPIELAGFIGEPVFPPGNRFEYSNSNYIILGIIIEAATGKKVSQVMREKFWQPLALNSFYFGAEEIPTGAVAAPWRDQNGDLVLEDISSEFRAAYHSAFYAAADVFSTAHDLAIWARELYADDGQAITVAARQKMLNFYFVAGQPDWDGYGLGVRRWTIAGRVLWGHTGGMRGYTTNMFWDPVRQYSIVILTNQSLAPNGGLMIREILTGTINLLDTR